MVIVMQLPTTATISLALSTPDITNPVLVRGSKDLSTSSSLKPETIAPHRSDVITPQHKHPANNLKGAVSTLADDRRLSSTAIELVLKSIEPASTWKVCDPSFVNDTATVPEIRLAPGQCKVLIPLHHESNEHWTVVAIDVAKKEVVHYDPLRFPVLGDKVTEACRKIVKHLEGESLSNKEWSFVQDVSLAISQIWALSDLWQRMTARCNLTISTAGFWC